MSNRTITSPLEGESLPSGRDPRVDREAVGRGMNARSPHTPLPNPPPQGGRERDLSAVTAEAVPSQINAADSKRICVARIGAAHGIRGEMRLWPFTADPLAVAAYGPLESADGVRFEIEALRPGKGFLVVRLKGIADRSAAERLNNAELFVPRERLPEPDAEGEYYHADLIGLAAVDAGGTALGTVVAVQNFGAGDLIEIQPPGGGETVLLPFTATVVPVVDIAGGRLVVHAPEELLRPPSEDRSG